MFMLPYLCMRGARHAAAARQYRKEGSDMATALLNQISSEFAGDALNRIASVIGESPGKIKTALGDILPALLGGLANKAQTQEGAHELLDVIHRDHLDTEQYDHVADAIQAPDAVGNLVHAGEPLLDSVLGAKAGVVTEFVASHAGIKPSSSKSLMSLALPLVLGLLGRQVGQSGESGLMNLLGKPRNFLQDLPSGLAGVLGMGDAAAASAARPALAEASRSTVEMAPASFTRKWLLPFLIVLGLGALITYFLARKEPATVKPDMPATTAPAAPTASMTSPALGAMVEKNLPGGLTINIPANGVESKLLTFIQDPAQGVSPDKWFSFDRLDFETGSATLKPSSQEQLSNVAAIMKSYPQVTIKIGGYTDNTGSPEKNLQLSQDRANSALQQLVALGIAPERMAAEGYGEKFPVVDNSTEEGRQRNRRVDVNVTKK
jgi:OOP family OmpA-OmpF porin